MTLLAQLTDTHVGPGDEWAENRSRLSYAVERLNAESVRPDAVALTGDLVNAGRPDEYRVLMDLLGPLSAPMLALPGNHDERDSIRELFPDTPWADGNHSSWVAPVGDITVIGLDSVHAGRPGGQVDDERLSWLEEAIHNTSGLTVLAMHHPPFAGGVWWMDDLGWDRLEDLKDVLKRQPVDHIICGHYHRPISTTVVGIPTNICIATAPPIELDLDPQSRPAIIGDPYGYQLIHRMPESDSVNTHIRFLDPEVERIYFSLDLPDAE